MHRSIALEALLLIFLVSPGVAEDAGDPPRISRVPILAQSEYPRWSPDGQRIAYMSNRDGNFEIYVMNADGSHPTRLTHSVYQELFPTWSPDGTRIAFSSDATGDWFNMPSQSAIFVMNADGSDPRRITNFDAGKGIPNVAIYNDSFPTWAPDGSKIAFLSDRDDGWLKVFFVRPDGSELTQATFRDGNHFNLRWTADSRRLAFDTRVDGFPSAADNALWGLFSISASGERWDWGDDLRAVRNQTEYSQEYDAAFLPDGATIVFLHGKSDPSKRTGRRGLTFARLDHSRGYPVVVEESLRQINDEQEYWADFSPAGDKIAFTSARDGHPEVYVMDADGGNVKRLTFSRSPSGDREVKP